MTLWNKRNGGHGDQLGFEGTASGEMTNGTLLYPELETWLRRAVVDLIPSAQESVREEISGHFEDAVRGRVAAGSSDSEAIALALRELGSPRRANRRLRREWLTQPEFIAIRAMAKRRKKLPDLRRRFDIMLRFFACIWIAIGALLCYSFLKFARGARPDLSPLLLFGVISSTLVLGYYKTAIKLLSSLAEGFIAAEILTNVLLYLFVLDLALGSFYNGPLSEKHSSAFVSWIDENLFGLVIGFYAVMMAWYSIVVPARLRIKCRRIRIKRGDLTDSSLFFEDPMPPSI